jgi:tRNA(fMet)-specific endonuclease VapC
MHLLDTNACIALLNGTSASLVDRLRLCSPSEIRLCSVVKAELLSGARHSARVNDNLRLLDGFFGAFRSLPFDDTAAEQYGAIRHDLEQRGQPVGANDLLIAAIALANQATLVTANVDEFSRVIGLQVENWQL